MHTNEPIDQKEKQKEKLLLEELDLRDYFAAKAMAAMLSIENVHLNNTETEIATWAYQQADAMMEVRQQKKDEVV
jgi:hypothetical protein